MQLRKILRWNERSETWKTVFTLTTVVLVTLSGYATFAMAMGTSTPLVVVTSGSMEPTLYRGDLLAIQTCSEDQIAVNDIIVFRADWNPETPIVHRVIEIIEDENEGLLFVTKGDNNHANDRDYRMIEDILGVVVFTVPLIGHVSLFLQTTEGKIIVFTFFLVLLAIPELYERVRKSD